MAFDEAEGAHRGTEISGHGEGSKGFAGGSALVDERTAVDYCEAQGREAALLRHFTSTCGITSTSVNSGVKPDLGCSSSQ